MTRFARSKGSKASNERVPENATTWGEMKTQLLEKNKEVVESKKKQKADKQREQNYKTFLEEVEKEETKSTQWAEFPSTQKSKKLGTNQNELGEQKRKKKKVLLNVVAKKGHITPSTSEPAIENESKTETKENPPNVVARKRSAKRKRNPSENKTAKPVEPIDKSSLTEEDANKVEKKKQKRLRQLEKKKLKKQENESNPQPIKQKPKVRDDKKHERRKKPQERMIINGKEVRVAYVDGFPIKKEDAERIHQLRKQMISKGLPRSEIKIALKLERRKAEKSFAREKKKVCFNCRKSGHNLSECPDLGKQLTESMGTGICFKCGSTEHTHFECKVVRGQEFKFAQCFICHEQGHIARQCPDNARGLYPKGGACNMCGDVTHLKRDCPKYQAQQQQLEQSVQIETISGTDNPDSLGKNEETTVKEIKHSNKIIKF